MTFHEVKNHANTKQEKESFIKITGKALCLLGMQGGHHSISCIRILESLIYLTTFHHGGSISTCPFDINTSPLQFLHILISISFTDYTTISFNTSIQWKGMNQTLDSDADESEHDNSEKPQLDSKES